ncbi:hypothetical protein AK812_SmicGene16585 [Symbiodinium microadriaticum]|uniref:Uncharacterized protein n=1 Tax=Symbiodinium microadriaticum TaxID=2951 RepID=A0A1Q9DZX1_SYMMI|nr:hypothetical protein AK812_SmicGene16585 [Symbiodinium microadriaticum]CAE7864076.1 unnamed protein product [Symbiodinium microadriaticum]
MDDSSLRRRRSRKEGDPEFDLGGELAVRSQEMTAVAGSGDAAERTAGVSPQEVVLASDVQIQDNRANPFWSERMKEEARLRAARPVSLNEAVTGSEQTSASTELRAVDDAVGLHPVPQGPPQVFGPYDDTSAAGPEERSGKGRGQTASVEDRSEGAGVRTTAAATGSEVASIEPAAALQSPGLRPAERQILTQMKELMESLFEQNSGIVQRLERLEEDQVKDYSKILLSECDMLAVSGEDTVPKGALIAELNCSVKWDHSSCEVPYQLAIDLIQELEDHRACVMQRALYLKSLAMNSNSNNFETSQNIEKDMNEDAGDIAALRWLQWLCPDTCGVVGSSAFK